MDTELSLREIRRRLSWVEFLAPLSEGELDDLVNRASFARLDEGEVLTLNAEQQAERMLLVVTGQLQVYEVAPSSGREHTLSVIGSGTPVWTTGLQARWARNLCIRALAPSVVCRVEQQDLEALIRHSPEVGLRLARALVSRLMLMEDRWADMAEKEVLARLAALLYMLVQSEGVMTPEGPMIPTRYTHQQLASMIGCQREAVTRAFAELQESGCIEVKSRCVYVKDPDALLRDAGE